MADGSLFFFGTLRDPDLFEAVAGRALASFSPEPARLAGVAVERVAGEAYPALVPRAAAVAEGLLLRSIAPAIVDRVAFYETTEYELVPAVVTTASGPVATRLFAATELLGGSGESWRLEDWQAEAKPLALAIAAAAMDRFGTIPLETARLVWPTFVAEARAALAAAERRSISAGASARLREKARGGL